MALTNFEKDMAIIQKLDDEPNDVGGMTAAELKAKFDEGGLAIKEYINGTLIPNVAKADTTINGHPMGQNVTVTKSDVDLGNVDNTSDADKPVSSAQQMALDLKADKSNVLGKDNITSYTPTEPYHPATKRYADTILADAVLGTVPDESIGPEKLTPAFSAYIDQQMPSGGIIMWSGASNNIPDGWALCNGQNGTPDLRGRFIVGAGGSYEVGNTGGQEKVTLTVEQLPTHSHGVSGTADESGTHTHSDTFTSTGSAGSHSHSFSYSGAQRTSVSSGSQSTNYVAEVSDESGTTSSSGSHSHSITGSVLSGGAHTHNLSINIDNSGSGLEHENRPPYYALCYIMRL